MVQKCSALNLHASLADSPIKHDQGLGQWCLDSAWVDASYMVTPIVALSISLFMLFLWQVDSERVGRAQRMEAKSQRSDEESIQTKGYRTSLLVAEWTSCRPEMGFTKTREAVRNFV